MDAESKIYKAIIGHCEQLENCTIKNGHHLAQRLAALVLPVLREEVKAEREAERIRERGEVK